MKNRRMILCALAVGCAGVTPDELHLFGSKTWGESEGWVERGGGEPYRALTNGSSDSWSAGAGLTWYLGAPSPPPPAYLLPSYIEVPYLVPLPAGGPTIEQPPDKSEHDPDPEPDPSSAEHILDDLLALWPHISGAIVALCAAAVTWAKREPIRAYWNSRRHPTDAVAPSPFPTSSSPDDPDDPEDLLP